MVFEKMLVCTDLSPASDALLQCVGEFKSRGLREIILAYVLHVSEVADTYVSRPDIEGTLLEEARPVLERQKGVLEEQGFRVITKTPKGVPAQTLNRLAEEHDVSVILIGSRGRGLAKSLALGSVSSRLLRITTRPVLLNRIALLEGEHPELVCRDLFRRVLFTTDFSGTAHRAFSYVGKIVESGCKMVALLHVQDRTKTASLRPNDAVERKKLDLERLEMLKASLMEKGAQEVAVSLRQGAPADEILNAAREGDFSLIVMGSQGRGFIEEIFIGSVSYDVLRSASLPVLLIPAFR